VAITTVTAQESPYHRTGDTVSGRQPIYLHQWWNDSKFDQSGDTNYFTDLDPYTLQNAGGIIMMRHYTPTAIKVIGIAGVARARNNGWGGHLEDVDSNDRQEYFVLYDATTDSLQPLEKVAWHPSDPHRTYRLKSFKYIWGTPLDRICNYADTVIAYHNLYEYYFDKPYNLIDSFYVGATTHSIVHYPEQTYNNYQPAYYCVKSNLGAIAFGCPGIPLQTLVAIPEKDGDGYSAGVPKYVNDIGSRTTGVFLIFPIIEIDYDTTPYIPYVCPSVENLRLEYTEGNQAMIMWNSNEEHLEWQVSLVHDTLQPDASIIDTMVMNPFYLFTGLDTCVTYYAYVRAICEHNDTTYLSDWSGPVEIMSCDTSGGTSNIIAPDDKRVTLMPNPTSKTVKVNASQTMHSITIFDTRGREVYTTRIESKTATVDVSAWSKGTYIVVTRGENGVTSHRLIVQ
jgi:hypothetical protein